MRLVLVHGVGASTRAKDVRDHWIGALARGMDGAGHNEVADRLRAGTIEVVLAHYAPLFSSIGAQGHDGVLPDATEAELLRELANDLIERLADQPLDARDRAIVDRARSQLWPVGRPQGVGALARHAIDGLTTLAAIGWWAGVGQWASDRLLIRDLRQVTRYLRRNEEDVTGRTLDQQIRDQVVKAVAAGPAVVVSHSLGTVVALEALHETTAPIRLLVTCGSPLGMRSVVLSRLQPSPPTTPSTVTRWLNLWDKDDPIVARSSLSSDVIPNTAGVGPEDCPIQSAGSWVHPARLYLAQPALAGPVAHELR